MDIALDERRQNSGVRFVPTYGFHCSACGRFDVIRPMADAATPAACPTCGRPGRRLFGVPALRALDPGVRDALDAGARSADAPDVVTAVPGRSRRRTAITTDPRHTRLPRP
jgi:putative FmdB family regulatory protein